MLQPLALNAVHIIDLTETLVSAKIPQHVIGGCIRYCFKYWTQLTTDPFILSMIQGIKLPK